MAITVTLPISAPTGLAATLQAGGTLAANTTYYFIVMAFDSNNSSPAVGTSIYNFHSPISSEASFSTDDINKSVLITWANVTNAQRYQVLLTTVSGEYFNSGCYGTGQETISSITSGVTGYIITSLSTETYVKHSIQLKNDFVGGDKQIPGYFESIN